jgi:hypothetical protein
MKRIPEPVMQQRAEARAHKVPCRHCPSAHFPPDQESEDILTWPHAERVRAAFPCGWNGKRYCKGYCDQMGVSDADLAELHKEAQC